MKNSSITKKALLTSILSLFVCFTMLLGTTFAWFTDSVTSKNNIIQSGTLDVEMYYADGSKAADDTADWKNAAEGAIFSHKLWEPGYVDAKHIKITNVGTLALNYKLRIVANGIVSKLADVIDVYYFATAKQLTRADLKNATAIEDVTDIAAETGAIYLGTLTEILGTAKNIANTVKGTLTVDAPETTATLALKMKESAGNEYQNLSIGTDFSVELIATQASVESDAFGTEYDAIVPSPEIPAALVRPLESLVADTTNSKMGTDLGIIELDVGYKFEPTISYLEAQKSEYRYWHADFVVSADRVVPANSMALAGYYDAWCSLNNDKWVALTADTDIAAGEQIRLVSNMANNVTVNWEEICNYGNDGKGFQCGAIDITGENAGTTITVELRIYETTKPWDAESGTANNETGNYITVGSFTYTFPKTVDTNAGLSKALAEGGTITLAAGEYKMPSNDSSTADLTIVGTKDTVVDVTLGAYMENANVTFKGVTIKTGTGMANGNGSDYAALYTPNVTYIDCTFEGPMRVGRDGAKFINCTFNSLGNDYVWTYGNDVTFEGCTFNSNGKAILIYSDGGSEVSKVTVKNCTFNATQGAKAGAINNQNCAAIEIHNYGNGVDLVTEGNTYDSNFSGEWRIKTYESGKPAIIVNGTTYTQIAVDGKLMTIDAEKNVTVQ